jgi:hypothetical protein
MLFAYQRHLTGDVAAATPSSITQPSPGTTFVNRHHPIHCHGRPERGIPVTTPPTPRAHPFRTAQSPRRCTGVQLCLASVPRHRPSAKPIGEHPKSQSSRCCTFTCLFRPSTLALFVAQAQHGTAAPLVTAKVLSSPGPTVAKAALSVAAGITDTHALTLDRHRRSPRPRHSGTPARASSDVRSRAPVTHPWTRTH